MEGVEGINSGVLMTMGVKAPKSCHVVASEIENPNPNQIVESQTAVINMAPQFNFGTSEMGVKKKRGRPRKYDSDGKVAITLSPMPISSLVPLNTIDFSGWKPPGKIRPFEITRKQNKSDFEIPGLRISYSLGGNFTPHVIIVNPGEDVPMKILSFSQQDSRAICILSANGTISNVTLRHAYSSGGTLTYEGRFEILSLTGSFMPMENEGTKSRSGGMSVSLAGPDGRVVGGGLAGLLVASGPVQVVLASFLPGHQIEQKPKKQKAEHATVSGPIISSSTPREDNSWANGATIQISSFRGRDTTTNNNNNKTLEPEDESKVDEAKGPRLFKGNVSNYSTD